MKQDLQKRFIYLMECLSIVSIQLTEYENYLSNGKWNEEKIKSNAFTINSEDNNKDVLIKSYREEYDNFKKIEELITNEIRPALIISNACSSSLMDEIEEIINSSSNAVGYVKGLLGKVTPSFDVVSTYTKNQYNGGLALEKLKYYEDVFIGKLYALCQNYNIDISELIKKEQSHQLTERQQTELQTNTELRTLPSELDADKAKDLLSEAIKIGLIDKNYNWLKGTQLCACFSQKASECLNLGKGVNSDGTKRIAWKPFETLFDIKKGKLRSALNDIKKTGSNPSDINLVDDMFR